MDTTIAEVHEDDFSRIGGEKPPHLKIEAALLTLGGAGVSANEFKLRALKAAGWKCGKMTPYGTKLDFRFPVLAPNLQHQEDLESGKSPAAP